MKQTSFLSKNTPPIKWAGGKRWLVPRLLELYKPHRHRRLVIPFAGGLGDLLGLWPEQALVNDVNPHLMNFYTHWRTGLDAAQHPDLFQNTAAAFDVNKRSFNELATAGTTNQESALLFYYLLRTCFNGLCRFNRKGEFNVSYGKYKKIDYNEWLAGYNIPPGWQFTCGDFSLLRVQRYSSENSPADYIYADPPYDDTFTGYSGGGFTWQSQLDLITWLAPHEGPVVISNAATDRIINLYQAYGYTIELIDAPRRISCDGDRSSAKEVLATRNF